MLLCWSVKTTMEVVASFVRRAAKMLRRDGCTGLKISRAELQNVE
jgi:hypothetical protein